MGVTITGGELDFQAGIDLKDFQAGIAQIETYIEGVTKTTRQQSAEIENFAKKASTALAAYATFSTASSFVQDVVRVRGEFQQLEVAFETMLGSKEKANKLMAEVTQFAAATPFELQEVAGATKQLLAFGLGANQIVGTLRSLGDVASGIGAPLGEIAYLYGTIKTAGIANNEDIKQFAQRGIPIYQELAKVLNTNVENVKDFVTAGKVGFPEVEKAFQNMTAAGSQFGGLMEAQSKTLTGQLSNLSDAWSQMLNDIGKSGQGVFADAIRAATSLVQNYQTVLDVLKVLVVTYGSYKAAVIATTAVQAIQTAATQGYTIVETLRYRAMLLSEAAMKLLNRTMLSNPFVAVAAGVTALVASLVVFGKTATEVKGKAELLAEAQERTSNSLAETEAKIRPYVERLKEANLSESERLSIYEKLTAIDPKIVAGIDAKSLSYQNLTANVNQYLDGLRKQIAIETNTAAITGSVKQEQSLGAKIKAEQKTIDDAIATLNKFKKTNDAFATSAIAGALQLKHAAEERKSILEEQLKQQKNVTSGLAQDGSALQTKEADTTVEAKKRTIKIIDEEIKAAKEAQAANSATSKEYQDAQRKINALEEERKRITGATKSEIKSAHALEAKTNDLLQERADILKLIQGLQDDASKVGQSRNETEIDRINKKYDDVLTKVDKFNRKAALAGSQKIGAVDIQSINDSRNKELSAEVQKQAADGYKKSIEEQRQVFTQFESYKLQVGTEKAAQLFAAQTQGYASYIDNLQGELKRLANDNSIGGQLKKQFLNEELTKAVKEQGDKQAAEKLKTFKDLLDLTTSYYDKELAIKNKYKKAVADLNNNASNLTSEQYETGLQELEKAQAKELAVLQDTATKASDIYERLGRDTINFSKKQIQEEINYLRYVLKNSKDLKPDLAIRITARIDELEKFSEKAGEATGHFREFAEGGDKVSASFENLASSLTGVNDQLAQSLRTVSSLVSGLVSAAKAYDKFKDAQSAQKQGGSVLNTVVAGAGLVGAAIGIVKGIAGIFTAGAAERKRQAEEYKQFLTNIYKGELAINALYRERRLEQAGINKLRLDGLKAEAEELKKQKLEIEKDAASVFNELQKETFKGTQDQVAQFIKNNPSLSVFDISKLIRDRQLSLSGLGFDELEKLFLNGQLEGRAKELFETLQKLKKEGVDVDNLTKEKIKAAQELLTGTTSDSITDSIVQGFKNGLHSAADFASSFEDLMRGALINSLKTKALEIPLKEFFATFADAADSDGVLTATEIASLQATYNGIIANADQQFQQLQQIAGLNFNASSSGANSLQGAIRGITEQTAELLAGQFGGLRLTAIDQLTIAKQALTVHQKIETNTALALIELSKQTRIWESVTTTGGRKINV